LRTLPKVLLYTVYILIIVGLATFIGLSFHSDNTPKAEVAISRSTKTSVKSKTMTTKTKISTSSKKSSSSKTSTPPSSTSSTSTSTSSSSASSGSASTQSLANTGPGDVIALFVLSTLGSAFIFRRWLIHTL
jgi:cytoskeletal protein RodZ